MCLGSSLGGGVVFLALAPGLIAAQGAQVLSAILAAAMATGAVATAFLFPAHATNEDVIADKARFHAGVWL